MTWTGCLLIAIVSMLSMIFLFGAWFRDLNDKLHVHFVLFFHDIELFFDMCTFCMRSGAPSGGHMALGYEMAVGYEMLIAKQHICLDIDKRSTERHLG